jgi:hypothetical protein
MWPSLPWGRIWPALLGSPHLAEAFPAAAAFPQGLHLPILGHHSGGGAGGGRFSVLLYTTP